MSFLDNDGLRQYTEKIKNLLNGFVPASRTVNGKALSSDITLNASDVGARSSTWNPNLSTYAPKASPVFTGSISLGRNRMTETGNASFAVGYNCEASNDYSFATGFSTKATAAYAHAEGYKSAASGSSSHAEGYTVTASGVNAHAEGDRTEAAGSSSHAEGYDTNANAQYSHAEGHMSQAEGVASHAEGKTTTASGANSHAEGMGTGATETNTHAEGAASVASAANAHAEGQNTVASGICSHAEGYYTTASNGGSHSSGKYSKSMTNGELNNQIGDVFIIGNGTYDSDTSRSNALRLAYEGTLYLTKAYNSTGADYAEYFEWLDGNPLNEDRVGHFVTLEGDKIKLAQEGDYILGVISGQPCVIGNADEDWLGRWEHDDFNRFVKEYLTHAEVEVFPPDDVTNAANPDEALQLWLIQNNVETRDGHYFKMETEVVDYPTASWRHKANPSYDPTQPYIERKDRQEWDAVGMVGVLSVIDDGTCVVNGYAKVAANGTATKADTLEFSKSWHVIARIAENVVKIVLK